MNTKAKVIITIYALAAGLGVGALGNSGIPAYAQQPTDPNCFGEQASNFPPGGMGEHSQAGSFAGEPPYDVNPLTGLPDKPGRIGIGNLPGHPSDIAAILGPLAGFPPCQP